MALGDPYVELTDFKARLNIVGTAQDDVIAQAILAASRAIDGMCGREFNQSESDEYRFFDASNDRRCWGIEPLSLGDVVSVTEIASDDGSGAYADVWDVDGYVLFPRRPRSGWPYKEVRPAPIGSSLSWPLTGYPIRVAGVFGWPEVPEPIVQATMRYAERLWALSRAPLGLSSQGEFASMIKGSDADVKLLVSSYRVRPI